MNFLAKGLGFLFSSMSSSEHEEKQEQEEVECSGSSSPVENKDEEEEELVIEEETPAFIAAATAAAKDKKKKKEPAEKKKKESKRERDSPSADAEGEGESEGKKGPIIDVPKATDRIKRSIKASFVVDKVDARVRKLVVTVPKGKRTKEYTYPYVDFPEEEIVQKLKEKMVEFDLSYMNHFNAAMYAPDLFWNAIHHWGSLDALNNKLIEAGVPNGQRRTRQKR